MKRHFGAIPISGTQGDWGYTYRVHCRAVAGDCHQAWVMGQEQEQVREQGQEQEQEQGNLQQHPLVRVAHQVVVLYPELAILAESRCNQVSR